jgi:hypothetical protein
MCAVRRLGALCARTEQSGPLDPRAAVNVDRDPIAATELSAVAKEPGRMLPDLKTTTWRRSRGSEASLALARISGNGFAAVLVELIESTLMDRAEQYIEIVGAPQGVGGAPLDGRLRHRLLVAHLAEPLPGGRAEDRLSVASFVSRGRRTLRRCRPALQLWPGVCDRSIRVCRCHAEPGRNDSPSETLW